MNNDIGANSLHLGEALRNRLPHLRRFARALVGDQNVGDSLVFATLQHVTKNKAILDGSSSPTVALYKSFISIFNGPIGRKCNEKLDADNFLLGCDATLSALSPETRQAFLLTTMEQFYDEEAAEIMDLDFPNFLDLKKFANREVAKELSASVFIIEDELLIAADLENIVTELGHIVIGKARTREEAVRKLRSVPADVILCDINLADGSSGSDAVNEILEIQDNVTVIFVTGYAERLLIGLHPEPTFLVEKPFTKDQVGAILSQVLFLKQTTVLPEV